MEVNVKDYKNSIEMYKQHNRKKWLTIIILVVAMFVLTIISINVGASNISIIEVIKAFFGKGTYTNYLIVWKIRMPRVIAAIVAGMGLSLSGCIMQNVLKNTMASPSTLGVSNAAVFGANFAIIVLGSGALFSTDGKSFQLNNPYLVTICAFVCAMAAVGIILALSKKRGFSPETIVLAGIGLGFIFNAATTIIQYCSTDTEVSAAVFWTFGDLSRATMNENLIMAIIVGISFIYFYWKRWDYNLMANGDDVAKSLGVRTEVTRSVSLVLASLITAVCVSFLGIIGFVGLIVPQWLKRIVGSDYRFLIPTSMLGGAVLLLLSDIIGRVIMSGISLPVGAITALIGGPVFLFMIFHEKKVRV